MIDLSAPQIRRDPYAMYKHLRAAGPIFCEESSGLWMVLDYEGVKRLLSDHESFSSQYGPDWMVFADPPRHTKLRTLISQAFTPVSIAKLETRIREITRGLLDQVGDSSAMDMAVDFAIPLPMTVIAEMLGIPSADRVRFKIWTDVILKLSYTINRQDEVAKQAYLDFKAVTVEMNEYLQRVLAERQQSSNRNELTGAVRNPNSDDLLTCLAKAEMNRDRLTQQEILGFFQLLLLAGSETTTNLINNAILCFIENPGELARLRASPDLLASAIEEVLRFRSPLQWIGRVTKCPIEMHGQTIPAGKLVLAMIGAANRDPKYFEEPNRFNISRSPNPHLAFGHGVHFCLGAPLGRLEARIALTEILNRFEHFELASSEPWEPRQGLHVLGPTRLPIRFRLRK